MKKIFNSLCINFLLLIISDAVPLKLIPGDRSVVKNNGTTHTITKYYIVPNDLDLNNVTDNTEASLKSTIQVNKSKYSKRMDLEAINEDQATEDKAEIANNQSDEHNDILINKSVDNVAEPLESVNTQLSLEPETLGTLQVEPITNSYNVDNSVINKTNVNIIHEGFRNESILFVDNSTQNIENDLQDQLGNKLLTKFGIAVNESAARNLESFWKLIKKYNINKSISDDNELLTRIEKLSLLLNIFTNLYEATQLQKPIESMIDEIVDILQKPYVKNLKSNRVESRFEPSVLGDQEIERECLRKCGLLRPKLHVDSNGVYLSETDGRKSSDNLELENGYLDLQRRQKGNLDDTNVRVNLHSYGLNQVTDGDHSINILRSGFPNNVNNASDLKGVPDGYNMRSSIETPNLKVITRSKSTLEDLLLNNNILGSAETGQNIKDLPWAIEDKTIDDLPWTIEDKSSDNLPRTIDDKQTTDNILWTIKNGVTENLPWTIEDKTNDNVRSIIENRATDNLPWTIEDNNLPWTTGNKIGHLPITLYQSSGPSLTANDGKITLEQNQTPLASTVDRSGKPYNIYTYIINPASKLLYRTPKTGNYFKVKSAQYNNNLGTKFANSYGLSTYQDKNKVVYTNKPSSSYYRSELSLSKEPSLKLSNHASNSLSKNKNNVDLTMYDIRQELNSQDNHQSKYINGFEKDTIYNPTIPLSNENDVPKVPETISDSGVPLPNVPPATLEPLLNSNIIKEESVSTASAQSDIGIYPENVYTEPNYYDSNIRGDLQASFTYNKPTVQVAYGGQTDKRPGLISKAPYSEYTQSVSDKSVSIASAQSDIGIYPENVYTEPNYYDSNIRGDLPASFIYNKPTEQVTYGGKTDKRPGLISKAPYSEYTQSANDKSVTTASAQSDIGIYPENVYTEPNYYDSNIREDLQASFTYNKPTEQVTYGGQTDKRPGLISKAPYSEYTQSASDYNTPTLIYGGETDNHPLKIPKALSYYPKYTKFPKLLVYGGETDNKHNFLGFKQPYGYVQFIENPNLIKYFHTNRLKHLKHLKRKLAPTYQLFALKNLLKLQDAIAREMQINGLKNHETRALTNFKKIISILLIMADYLAETEGSNSNEWYKKIFYNVQQRRNPLHLYAYNLLRQRWLHELMILLYKNNFNLNILHKPRICSFLGAWRFPNNVQRFLETKGLPQGNFDGPNALDQTLSTHTVISNNIATQTHNYYREPNEDIVVTIAGVEAEPDALSIIEILQKYLLKKSYIENQENVIIRDNKIEMLKHIEIFLREKGYSSNIIEDLIRKLYSVIYSAEGKRCPTAYRRSIENMYDIILPILTSSKQ